MATIYNDDKVVLFGGQPHEGPFIYVFDLSENSWREERLSPCPDLMVEHGMAGIYGDDKVVLFGMRETWVYDLSDNQWTNMHPGVCSTSIKGHKMATIYNTDKVLLFGGVEGSSKLRGTWIYDISSNTWSKKNPISSPSARSNHGMASIPNEDKVILFGGDDGSAYLNDTWVYDMSDNQWTNITPVNAPCPRSNHGMATIYNSKKVALFGGPYGNDETWMYDLDENQWTKKSLTDKPSSRFAHGMATIYATDKVILFGGCIGGGSPYDDATWVYEANEEHASTGIFISSPYDCGTSSGFHKIKYTADMPFDTSVKFQLKTATKFSELSSKDFLGYDGTSESYYTTFESNIWNGHYGDRWLQYKAFLCTNDKSQTPTLKDVTIDYNCLPFGSISTPLGEKSGDIFINYTLTDFESDLLSIIPQYSVNGNTFYTATKGKGGDGIEYLASSPNGTLYTFVWDSEADLRGGDFSKVYFRIIPKDMDDGMAFTSFFFHIDNNALPVISNVATFGNSGDINITYTLIDDEQDKCNLTVEYQGGSIGKTWNEATIMESITRLLPRANLSLTWKSNIDEPNIFSNDYRIRITPKDNDKGSSGTSPFFVIDNEIPSIMEIGSIGVQTNESITLTAMTSEKAYCRWSNLNQSYNDMPEANQFSNGEMNISHSTTVNAKEGINTYYISAMDLYGNGMRNGVAVTFEVDSKPPSILSFTPSSLQTSTQVELVVRTDESAYCRWHTSNVGYHVMSPENQFTTGEKTTNHSTTINAVEGSNTFYVTAMDLHGNIMNKSIEITFEVDSLPPTIISYGPSVIQTSLEVTITANTNENASLRWSTYNVGYDSMSPFNQFTAGEGTTNHSTIITAVEGLNSFYISALDVHDNAMPAGVEVTFIVNTSDNETQNRNPIQEKQTASWWSNWEPIVTIFTIFASVVVSAYGYLIVRKKRKRLKGYLEEIDGDYNTYFINLQMCENKLLLLKDKITHEFEEGKMNENHYFILEKKINDYLSELKEKERVATIKQTFMLPKDIEHNIRIMLDDGRITPTEYQKFIGMVESTSGAKIKDMDELQRLLGQWMEEDKSMYGPMIIDRSINENVNICEVGGVEIEKKELHCPNCRNLVKEGDKFCMGCGGPLKELEMEKNIMEIKELPSLTTSPITEPPLQLPSTSIVPVESTALGGTGIKTVPIPPLFVPDIPVEEKFGSISNNIEKDKQPSRPEHIPPPPLPDIGSELPVLEGNDSESNSYKDELRLTPW